METCYRVQVPGGRLHGVRSVSSAGVRMDGVYVFGSVGEIDVNEWMDEGPVELAEVVCGLPDLRDSGDVQGYLLRRGRGRIIGRSRFESLAALKEHVRKLQRRR